ncbi:uncharacterized protein LOC144161450 [Haemaphysalis longicornis]
MEGEQPPQRADDGARGDGPDKPLLKEAPARDNAEGGETPSKPLEFGATEPENGVVSGTPEETEPSKPVSKEAAAAGIFTAPGSTLPSHQTSLPTGSTAAFEPSEPANTLDLQSKEEPEDPRCASPLEEATAVDTQPPECKAAALEGVPKPSELTNDANTSSTVNRYSSQQSEEEFVEAAECASKDLENSSHSGSPQLPSALEPESPSSVDATSLGPAEPTAHFESTSPSSSEEGSSKVEQAKALFSQPCHVTSKLSGDQVKSAAFPSEQRSKPLNPSSAAPIGASSYNTPGRARSSEPTAHPRRFGGARPRTSPKPPSPAQAASSTSVKPAGSNGGTPARPPPRSWAPFRTPNLSRYSPRARDRVFAPSDRGPKDCVAHRSGGNPATCGIASSGGNSLGPDNGSTRRSPQKKGARRRSTKEDQEGGKPGADETPNTRRAFRNAGTPGDGAPDRREQPPVPLPRNVPVDGERRKAEAERWIQCPLPHVDPTDSATMYLMSLRERIARFSPKKKSMMMVRMQEVLHEVEFLSES